MTPKEWEEQIPPPETTRHELSVSLGQRVFYRDDVTPHQQWNGFRWVDIGLNGNCHSYTTPLSEPPYLYTSRNYLSDKRKVDAPIYTDAKYKGD